MVTYHDVITESMGLKGPEKERLPLVIEGPAEAVASVRTRVFQALAELPLAQGTQDSPILFMRADIKKIADLAAGIEGAQLLETREEGYVLRLREEKKVEPPTFTMRQVPATASHTVRVKDDGGVDDDDDDGDDPGNRTWVSSGEWTSHFQEENTARDIAREINRPRAGNRWPKKENQITVSGRRFHYKGESISITNDRGKVLKPAEVKKWMREVNARRRQ